MPDLSIQHTFERAAEHHKAGRLREAEELYRQILADQPEHAGALHHLALIAHQAGQIDEALKMLRRAISLNPGIAQAHYHLGIVLAEIGQRDQAIAAYRQAIAVNPNLYGAHNNLGGALLAGGHHDEAIAAFRQAIAVRPDYFQAYNNLGNALSEKGHYREAIVAYRQCIALNPGLAETLSNLGNALRHEAQLDEAIGFFHRAIALKPELAEAYCNLGNGLRDRGQLDEAIAAFRQAIAIKSTFAEAHSNLGNALRDKGQLEEAIAACRAGVALRPNLAEAYNHLGNALREGGQPDEAVAAYRQAVALKPDYDVAHSNLVLALHYHPGFEAAAIAEELGRWDAQHTRPLKRLIQPHKNDRSPDRPLRVGYVSPDFRDHPVGRNLLPWFHLHDRERFEIVCYAHVVRPDAMTAWFREIAGGWREIVGLPDEKVAGQIREDRIDILVDLALHTAHNRLPVFANKPAPVQVSYLGYCGSTGMSTMDYRISDPYLDPPGGDESAYSEKTIRLPRTYWCYRAPADSLPEPGPSPVMANGFITFGCQNNYSKISAPVWEAWTEILRAKPNSRLLIYCGHGSHRETARGNLAAAGVDPKRLLFSDARGSNYFLRYNEIDIALDPFPFCGGTTTCDALWMGVPVVTLSGKTAVGRGGRSILSNLGLPELIAFTTEDYIKIAVGLANDRDRLEALRRGMRARMLASALMDGEQFVRNIEALYRRIWRDWCDDSIGGA
jgi:predicted O-linked N-acetylglucosamine transferase (SPINDLY family)